MSSDPIEVLRELPELWRESAIGWDKLESGQDASRWLRTCADELESALASLSAPKPESAEAVGEVFGPKEVSTMVALERPLPPGTKLYTAPPRPEASESVVDRAGAVRLAQAAAYASHHTHDYLPHTAEEARNWQPHEWVVDAILAATLDAAPQEASAPVGVEGFDAWWKSHSIDPEFPETMDDRTFAKAAWDAALAQQPAAVDGAMVERACAAALKEGGKGTHNSRRIMRAALTAALAGQQQGGES